MKINKTVHNTSVKKKSKKVVLKKTKVKKKSQFNNLLKKNQIENLGESTSSFCSFDNISTITDSNSQILLTPSKSESDLQNQNIPELEYNDNSFALIEDSFNNSLEEDDSYTYNSIADELIYSEIQNGEAKIISLPNKEINLSENLTEIEENVKEIKDKRKKRNLHVTDDYNIRDLNVNNNSEPTVQYYYTSDGIVVILDKDDTLYFHGLMSVLVLHGEIEVLGYKITKNCQDIKLYSLRSGSLLCLKNRTKSDVPVTHYLMKKDILNKINLSENCAIVLCKKLQDPSISFIEKHIAQQILPRYDETCLPRVVFQPKGNWNLYKSNEEWNNFVDGIHNSTKMMVCGGKGVGKSTFLRYAINRLLMKFDEIQVIDLDPGQPEFTIPGIISVVRISEPLFGANFTHLKTPERSILANINVAYEPDKYIESVRYLLEYSINDIPTLINFVGFSHSFGINILSAVIIQVQPTDIVQIQSDNNKKNYKQILTPDVVLQNAKLFMKTVPISLDYKLHLTMSVCDENDVWTAEPRQLREMNILAYLSTMTESNSLFKSTAPHFRINLQQINISDLNGKIIHPAAVNASLVGLCSLVDESQNIFQCHGWGIVRGVDVKSKVLVLFTLEKPEILDKVHHVVLNSAPLPPSIFMTPDEIVGQVPYVMEGILMSFGQIPKRSRLPVKNKE